MLEKIGRSLLKYKGAVLLTICILFVVTIVGTVFLVISDDKINSDMVSYLDSDSDTKKGLTFLKSQFGIRGNATLVVRVDERDEHKEENLEKFHNAVANIEKMKEVNGVTWYGSVSSYDQLDDNLNEILSTLNEHRDYLEEIITKVYGEEN